MEEESKAKLIQGFIFYRDIINLFITGPSGSEGVRYVLVALVAAIGYPLLLLLRVYASEYLSIDSFLWQEESILILWVTLLAIPVFDWSFKRYRYAAVTLLNTLLIVAFITLVSGVQSHYFTSNVLTVKQSFISGIMLFFS